MYDINCEKVFKALVEAGYCFDYEFYEYQKTRRFQVMCVKTSKVDVDPRSFVSYQV